MFALPYPIAHSSKRVPWFIGFVANCSSLLDVTLNLLLYLCFPSHSFLLAAFTRLICDFLFDCHYSPLYAWAVWLSILLVNLFSYEWVLLLKKPQCDEMQLVLLLTSLVIMHFNAITSGWFCRWSEETNSVWLGLQAHQRQVHWKSIIHL